MAQTVIPVSALQASRGLRGTYSSYSSSLAGAAGVPRVFVTIANPLLSGFSIFLKRAEYSALGGTSLLRFARATVFPTLGTLLTPERTSTAFPASIAEVRTLPTATLKAIGETAYGFTFQATQVPLPWLGRFPEEELILAPGEAVGVVSDVSTAGLSFLFNFLWQEGR